FEKGETNVLERTTAQTQRGQIGLQLQQLGQDEKVLQHRFKLLLNTDTDLIPIAGDFKLSLNVITDASFLSEHPQVKYLEQLLNIASAQTRLERSKLSPDLSLSFFNQSFKGFQYVDGTDKYFSGGKRFSSVQAGMGIPIFTSAQRARIKASKINQLIIQN